MDTKKSQLLRQGLLVFIALAVITGIEYFVGTNGAFLPAMVLMALVKAGLVLWYYMHIRKVFTGGEE
ncbi:MAG TPA: cytochrome C oxidase subunit IV family protein [Anaerolineaceae bacterium]|nr:cytochrome C oxidase subunit IV family protein [Anaerolineaceae bacterium]